jgi:hypothetical protein
MKKILQILKGTRGIFASAMFPFDDVKYVGPSQDKKNLAGDMRRVMSDLNIAIGEAKKQV